LVRAPWTPSGSRRACLWVPAQCTSLLDPSRARFWLKLLVQNLHDPLQTPLWSVFLVQTMFFTCILLQSSILRRLFGCIRSVSGSASYGVQGHSVNARMQSYADAQQARASSPVLSTRCFCGFCTLALGHPCRGAGIKSSTGVKVLHKYRVLTLSSPFSAT